MLELKRKHSFRVAANARKIAADTGASESKQNLAESAGLVHDVGRFPQFSKFGSFRDTDTVNHGISGRAILESQDILLPLPSGERTQLLYAVEYHNRSKTDIPFKSGRNWLLKVLRDADKLDIMELTLGSLVSDGFSDLSDMLPHISLNREVTPEVIHEALATGSVSIERLSTLADFLIMIATWFYDLYYVPTRKLAHERSIFLRIRQELPDSNDIEELFADILDSQKAGRLNSETAS